MELGDVDPAAAVFHAPAVWDADARGVTLAKVIPVRVALGGQLVYPHDAFGVLICERGRRILGTGRTGALAGHGPKRY
jgi:hypothetical protein